jgi:hypothetical protein
MRGLEVRRWPRLQGWLVSIVGCDLCGNDGASAYSHLPVVATLRNCAWAIKHFHMPASARVTFNTDRTSPVPSPNLECPRVGDIRNHSHIFATRTIVAFDCFALQNCNIRNLV